MYLYVLQMFCYLLMSVTTFTFLAVWEQSHYVLFVQGLALFLLDCFDLVPPRKVHFCKILHTRVHTHTDRQLFPVQLTSETHKLCVRQKIAKCAVYLKNAQNVCLLMVRWLRFRRCT